jgi:hypothetical protein
MYSILGNGKGMNVLRLLARVNKPPNQNFAHYHCAKCTNAYGLGVRLKAGILSDKVFSNRQSRYDRSQKGGRGGGGGGGGVGGVRIFLLIEGTHVTTAYYSEEVPSIVSI